MLERGMDSNYKLDILVFKLTIGVISYLATYKAMFLHSALILGSIAVFQVLGT